MGIGVDDLPYHLHNIFIIVRMWRWCCVTLNECFQYVCVKGRYSCADGIQTVIFAPILHFRVFEDTQWKAMDTFLGIIFYGNSLLLTDIQNAFVMLL